MNKKSKWAKMLHAWNTELTNDQREYLKRRYKCFYKALEVFTKAKASGMIDFELLEN